MSGFENMPQPQPVEQDSSTQEQEPKKIALQQIYDLRELTGFVSGSDLHELFRDVTDGEPSPSGYVEVDEKRLEENPIGKEALRLLNSPLKENLAAIKDYYGPQ